jgi:hypothetical protein
VLRQPWAVAAAALVLVTYLAVWRVMPKGAFWSPDEGAKYIQLHSIEWGDGLRYAIAYGGQRIDPDFRFYPARCRNEDIYPMPLDGGRVRFHWPIWFPLASRVPVALFGLSGLYLLPLLSGWLVAVAAGCLVGRAWEPRLAPLVILAVGLATPVAFFSLTFWEHTVATLLAVTALLIVATAWPTRMWAPIAALPALLAAVALRIEVLPFAAALICAWAVALRLAAAADPGGGPSRAAARRSAFIAFSILGVLGVLLAAYDIGGGMPERHRWILSVIPTYLSESVGKLRYVGEMLTSLLVDEAGNQAPVIPDLWRYLVLVACLVAVIAPWLRSARVEAIALLAALGVLLEFSLYLIVRPQPYISLHGFVPIAPFTVLGTYAVAAAWRQRSYPRLVIAGVAAMYVALALLVMFIFLLNRDGVVPTGLEWGNRYLFTLYPIGTVLALAGVYEYRRSQRTVVVKRAVSVAAAALLVCGLLLQIRGVWMLVESRRLVTTWQTALRGELPVMTDVWWLPAAMAPLFIDHALYCVRTNASLGEWLSLANAHGVDSFTFASFRRLDPRRIQHAGLTATSEDEQIVSGLHLTRIHIAPAALGAVPGG